MVEPYRYPEELTMKVVLIALLSSGLLTAANLLVSAVAMALGTFVAISRHWAARIWGPQRLASW